MHVETYCIPNMVNLHQISCSAGSIQSDNVGLREKIILHATSALNSFIVYLWLSK